MSLKWSALLSLTLLLIIGFSWPAGNGPISGSEAVATINIWKHRYPFYGGGGYYPYWGGYGFGGGYGGGYGGIGFGLGGGGYYG